MLGYEKIVLNNEADWIVFLHGLGGNSSLFYKQKDFFSAHYNLLLINLPGHGDSPGLSADRYSAEEAATEVVKILNQLDIPKAHIMAFSLGTIIANSLMIIAPEKIKTLILAGPVLNWSWWANILVKGSYRIRHIAPYMAFYKIFAYLMMPRKNHQKSRGYFIREAAKLGRREFMKWIYMVTIPEKAYMKTLLFKIEIPKLYIIGGEDHMFLSETIKAAHHDQSITLHIINGCGHVCILENSTETNNTMHKFLLHNQLEKEQRGGSPVSPYPAVIL
ncbi:hypothetical protein BK139_06895 [Paenibacillus sp. FSL R5-0490]|uniref:alpha/beta fold hydrolase n=1 Tax=Paenibacillus sp. FSL R5-0490 TaxID=1920424 RepID=UPI00096DFA85|nr:alpha/beta hydrolase [Paenibacillus sp. FSL R5-0490]OMF61559.1 hypothetical protein BK139_06895 [Paenibacillus sp. FSL R5-0490]